MGRPLEYRDVNFKPTIFNRIKAMIEERRGTGSEPIALHVGDTHFDIPDELTTPLEREPWNHLLSRYGDTQGEVEVRRRLVEKARQVNGLPAKDEREVQICFGATGGLHLAMHRLLEPGSEVLTLSPYWTIFRVVANAAGVKAVEVPFFDRVAHSETRDDITEWLEPYRTDKTRAIYFNNPNNPSGVMLSKSQLARLAGYAREHDLWILSDEAYEDFVWADEEYVSIGSLPGMYERTVSIFSFSKSYAAAGIRLGYVVAPVGVIASINPAHVGIGYEANRPSQVQGIRGLERSERVIPKLQAAYAKGRRAATENISLPHLPAEGSFYLFVDLRDRWMGLSDDEKLERMLRAGVVVSPGEAFGSMYEGWARFCYTSEPPELVAEAARRLAKV